jgi:hypothetical protein
MSSKKSKIGRPSKIETFYNRYVYWHRRKNNENKFAVLEEARLELSRTSAYRLCIKLEQIDPGFFYINGSKHQKS